jgi:DNA mismatch endonuclease, patch repair protein
MTDNLNPEDRRKTMRAVKGKNTRLERQLRSMLAGMRISGWRTNAAELEGKPDVVFDSEKVVIFVDGCFWHGCPVCRRKLPQTNREYWIKKISRNCDRDQTNTENYARDGWYVIRIWEHELRDRKIRKSLRRLIRSVLQESSKL